MTTNGVLAPALSSTVKKFALAAVDAGHLIAREHGPMCTITALACSQSDDKSGLAMSTALRHSATVMLSPHSTGGPGMARGRAMMATTPPANSRTATMTGKVEARATRDTPIRKCNASYAGIAHIRPPGTPNGYCPVHATGVTLGLVEEMKQV